MATNNLFNVPSWTSVQELFFRRLGIKLDPALVSYSFDPSETIPVSNQLLVTGTGNQNRFVVEVDGVTVSSVSGMVLVRTDWDGTWTLSRTAHANGVLYSDTLNASAWQLYFATVTPSAVSYGGQIPYWNISSSGSNWETGIYQTGVGVVQPNDSWTAVVALRATASNNAAMLAMTSSDGSGLNYLSSQVLTGPGALSYTTVSGAFPGGSGVALSITNLSTTQDSLVALTVQNTGASAITLNVGVYAGTLSTYNTNVTVLATRVSVNKGAAQAYISNGAAVVSQADYSLIGSVLTTTNNLAEGGTLIWSGQATLPPTITITANPTAPDGSQGPYLGSVTYPLGQLQITNELPAMLVWSDVFPMTVDQLANFLLANYGYYMEDGEFFVTGDPNHTPLVRGGGLIYNGLNATNNTFSLTASPGAVRWLSGSKIQFTWASSNSIVPANGFAITSPPPPAGVLGASYSYTYTVTNGTPPYTFAVIQGTSVAPVNASTGVMASTQLQSVGTYSWVIQVTDYEGRIVTREDQVTVAEQPLAFNPPTLTPTFTVGVPVDFPLNVTGGQPPYDYEVYLGALPSGVAIVDGAIQGTFEGSLNSTQLSLTVGIQVTDVQQNKLQRLFTFTINDRAAADIQAALRSKVLHWFENNTNLYTGNLGINSVVYDATGRTSLQVTAAPGAGNNATLGAVATGRSNQPMGFDFTDKVYLRNQTVAYNLPDNFAIMALVNLPSQTGGNTAGQALISRGADAHGGYDVRIGADGTSLVLDLNMSGTVENVAFPQQQLLPGSGNWYFCVLQKYGNVPEMEINAGASTLLGALAGSLVPNQTEALFIGSDPALDAASFYGGNLGMIGLFTDKLWSDERKWLYNGGAMQGFAALNYWPDLTITASKLMPSPIPLGEAFEIDYTFSGGSGHYVNVSTTPGSQLPPGLGLSYDGQSKLTLSGTPTVAGTYSFGIQVVSTDGQANNISYTAWPVQTVTKALVNLPMTGTAGQTTVSDSTGRAWTVNGNAVISTAVSSQGAVYLDGINSSLSTPVTSDFNFAGNSYTVEIDVYPTAQRAYLLTAPYNQPPMPITFGLDGGTGNPGDTDGMLPFFGWSSNGQWYCVRSSLPAVQNSWNTIKGVYDVLSKTLRVFVDGQFGGSYSPGMNPVTVVPATGNNLMVGERWDGLDDEPFTQGYVRNLTVELGASYDTLALGGTTFNATGLGASYTGMLPILGGNGAYSAPVVTAGALPPGLTLSTGSNTLNLTGTPTTPGSYAFTVQVASGDGQSCTTPLSMTVNNTYPPLTLSGNFTTPATLSASYQSSLAIGGGNGPYSSPLVQSGTLPPGLTLSIAGASLLLSGTPTVVGTYTFVVSVTSSDGQTALSSPQSLTVTAWSQLLINLPMSGTAGQTSVTDTTGRVWSVNGNAMIETTEDANGAMHLDGTNSYLSTPITTDFNFGTNSYTAEIDIFPAGARAYLLTSPWGNPPMPLVMGLDAGTGNPGDNDGMVPFFGWNIGGGWLCVRSSVAATPNAWNTIKGMYDDATHLFKVFVNGQYGGSYEPMNGGNPATAPVVVPAAGNNLMVGVRWDGYDNQPYTQGYVRNLTVGFGLAYDTLTLASTTFPAANAGSAYASSIAILGGNGVYSGLVVSGQLPTGLTMALGTNALNLTGTPTSTGTFNVTVQFQSGDGQTYHGTVGVTVDSPSFTQAMANASPTAYWRLNETSGSTAADSMGSYPATYGSSGLSLGSAGLVPGDSDTAVSSLGTGVVAQTVATTGFNSVNISAMAVIKPTLAASGEIVAMGNRTVFDQQGFLFQVNTDGSLTVNYWSDGGTAGGSWNVVSTAAGELLAGVTYIVGFSLATTPGSSSTVIIYINGMAVETVKTNSQPYLAPTTAYPFLIGAQNSGSLGNFYPGAIGQVAVWTSVLPASTFQSLAQTGQLAVANGLLNKLVTWLEWNAATSQVVDKHVNRLTVSTSGASDSTPLGEDLPDSASFTAGANTSVETATSSLLELPNAVAAMLWTSVQSTQPAAYPKLMWMQGQDTYSGYANYLFQLEGSPQSDPLVVRFRTSSGTQPYNDVLSTAALTPNTPYCLVGQCNLATTQLYINGALNGSVTFSGTAMLTSAQPLIFGYQSDSGKDPVNGKMFPAAVFNQVLSPFEISYLYNYGVGVSYAMLSQGYASVPFGWNALNMNGSIALSASNMIATSQSAGQAWKAVGSYTAPGKRYIEYKWGTSTGGLMVGMSSASTFNATANNVFPGQDARGFGIQLTNSPASNGLVYVNGAVVVTGPQFANGDVIGIATDGQGNVWIAQNNVWIGGGNPAAGTGATVTGLPTDLMPAVAFYDVQTTITGAFTTPSLTYAPPSGFVAYE